MLSRRYLLALFPLTAAGTLLASCGRPSANGVSASKTLTATIGYPEPHTIFAPGGGGGGPGFSGSKVLERLARLNTDQTFTPVLAESWTLAQDAKSVSIRLREGIKWHDGQPFTAEDVVWTVKEYWKPFFPQTILDFLSGVEATGSHDLIIRFDRPVPEFSVGYLFGDMTNYILPKHLYAGTDILLNPLNNAPVGTGPWKFSKWVRGSFAEFVRNPDYWVSGQPKLDKLIIRWWREPASRAAAFETGELDVGVSNPAPLGDIERLKANPNLNIRFEDQDAPLGLHFNTKNPVVSDVRVRRALLHAIDREFIAKTVYYGLAHPAISPILSTNKLYFNPDVPTYEFDPALAARLLNEAGYPKKADGKRFTLNLLASGWSEENGKAGAYLKQVFEDLGIVTTLKVPDRANSLKALYTDYDFDVAYSQGGGTYNDPIPDLPLVFGTAGISKGLIFRNGSRYSNPKLDTLFDQIKQETDTVKRKADIDQAARIILEDAPLVPLIEWPTHIISQKTVHFDTPAAQIAADSWGDVWKG